MKTDWKVGDKLTVADSKPYTVVGGPFEAKNHLAYVLRDTYGYLTFNWATSLWTEYKEPRVVQRWATVYDEGRTLATGDLHRTLAIAHEVGSESTSYLGAVPVIINEKDIVKPEVKT